MKIVIDIPEEEYKRVKDGRWYGNGLADYIENGTPLPKGHGKLKDVDAISLDDIGFFSINDYLKMVRKLTSDEDTVIEADKGGEQE